MSVVRAHDDRPAGLANRAARWARNAQADSAIAFLHGAALCDPRSCLNAGQQDRGAAYAL